MIRLGLVAVLVAAVAAAAGHSQTPNDEILVTRDSTSLPMGCTPRQVARLLLRFTDAFNRGDRKTLSRLFPDRDPPGRAREPAGTVFRWYSVGDVAFYDLKDLFPYFVRRHRQDERLRLLAVNIGPSSRPRAAAIAYALEREADDLPPTLGPFAHGKAEIDCRRQRIYVWSMTQGGSAELRTCPLPAQSTSAGPVVACARSGSAPKAQEVAANFLLGTTPVRLPKRCRPSAVAPRVELMLRSFNLGDPDGFARGFTSAGQFHPYTASIRGSGFIGRPKIAAYARKRYTAGDGWSAISLHPPSGFLRDRAVYQLTLHVVNVGEGGAKLVLDCRSGPVTGWIGPAVRQPG